MDNPFGDHEGSGGSAALTGWVAAATLIVCLVACSSPAHGRSASPTSTPRPAAPAPVTATSNGASCVVVSRPSHGSKAVPPPSGGSRLLASVDWGSVRLDPPSPTQHPALPASLAHRGLETVTSEKLAVLSQWAGLGHPLVWAVFYGEINAGYYDRGPIRPAQPGIPKCGMAVDLTDAISGQPLTFTGQG